MGMLDKLIENTMFLGIIKVVAKIIIIWLLALIITRVGNKAIEKVFQKGGQSTKTMSDGRAQTLTKLSHSILYYVVYFIAGITILDMFISITPLLTGAGVLGLAIGFGAQGLVKDVVTGFFILFEGQYDVGDKVKINGIDGVVEELGIRTTKTKGEDGELIYISNGTITQVMNYSKGTEKKLEA